MASRLKTTPRQGWINKLNLKGPESVADHTYMMSLMSMVISDQVGLDTLKILQMSLLHDLAESKIGDITPGEMSDSDKTRLENKAMGQILSLLPSSISDNYQEIWNEYQAQSTPESKLVHDIDKLEMALQAQIYSKDAGPASLQSFFESAKQSIDNSDLQNILDDIISK